MSHMTNSPQKYIQWARSKRVEKREEIHALLKRYYLQHSHFRSLAAR
jgi:hypothetical protein